MVSVAMPLSQQAGYYCNVCDCVLRDSQSYLDHINGGWVGACKLALVEQVAGGLAEQAVGQPAAYSSCSPLAPCSQRSLRCRTAALRRLPAAILTQMPCHSAPHLPTGKWHNRALGMSMRVEKSTAEQVWSSVDNKCFVLDPVQCGAECSLAVRANHASACHAACQLFPQLTPSSCQPFPPVCTLACCRYGSGWRRRKSARRAAAAARRTLRQMVRRRSSGDAIAGLFDTCMPCGVLRSTDGLARLC